MRAVSPEPPRVWVVLPPLPPPPVRFLQSRHVNVLSASETLPCNYCLPSSLRPLARVTLVPVWGNLKCHLLETFCTACVCRNLGRLYTGPFQQVNQAHESVCLSVCLSLCLSLSLSLCLSLCLSVSLSLSLCLTHSNLVSSK